MLSRACKTGMQTALGVVPRASSLAVPSLMICDPCLLLCTLQLDEEVERKKGRVCVRMRVRVRERER